MACFESVEEYWLPSRSLLRTLNTRRKREQAKYEGTCVLSTVVGPDGKPRDIRIQRGLGMGLDQKAIQAVNQWRFDPATKDGRAVAVQISVEVSFKLY